MKFCRKLLSLLLLTALLLTAAAPSALAASGDCCEVAISGVENYTEAFDVLTLVNELRASVGVQALTMDETLMEYAMFRAAELAICYSHTRPDGSAFNSGCSKASGENIAMGAYTMSTAQEAYTGWYNSQGHYENMVREEFSSIGIGSFTVGNFNCWVQVFSRASSSGVTSDIYPENMEVIVTTNALTSHIKDTITPVLPDNASLLLSGDTVDFKVYSLDFAIKTDFYSDLVELPSNSLIYQSSNANVCTVNQYGRVTAIGSGNATLTAWYPGLENDPWSFDITVCSGHEYNGIITLEPGCGFWDTGEMTYTCIHCKGSYTETIYGSHTYDDGVVTTEATCGTNGFLTYTCTRCGSSYAETIYATGAHTYNEGVVTEAPTCKDWGTMTYTCSGCGGTKTEDIKPHDNHTYGEGEVTREPTCNYQGVIKYTCTICNGGGYIETIDALGHDWDNGVVTTEPTCNQQGWLTKTCSRCGSTTMEDLGFSSEHAWDEGTIIRQPSLLQNGEIRYNCTLCTVTKTEPLDLPAGDVNGSGQTDAVDIVVLMKYILDNSTTVNTKAIDLNDDGRTDILDVIRLIRWLADV